jgi:hypothetical protein
MFPPPDESSSAPFSVSGRRGPGEACAGREGSGSGEVPLAPPALVLYTRRLEPEYPFTFIAPNVEQVLGDPWATFLEDGAHAMERIHPEDRSDFMAAHAVLGERGAASFYYRMRHAKGHYCWVRDEVSLRMDAAGEPLEAVGAFCDVTERRQDEETLLRRDAILESIGYAAEQLLQATGDLRPEITGVLAKLGQATDVSRVYIFQDHRRPSGELVTSQRYEWVAPGVKPELDNPALQNFCYRDCGMDRWVKEFAAGGVIQGHVREFPASERAALDSQDIRSLLVMPIMAPPGQVWGFVGFDDCKLMREWSVQEVEALRAAARILGAVVRRGPVL